MQPSCFSCEGVFNRTNEQLVNNDVMNLIRNAVNNYLNVQEFIPLEEPVAQGAFPPPPGALRLLPSLNIMADEIGRRAISEMPDNSAILLQSGFSHSIYYYRLYDEIYQVILLGANDVDVRSVGFVDNE